MSFQSQESANTPVQQSLKKFWGATALLSILLTVIAWLSFSFNDKSPPIATVTFLFMAACLTMLMCVRYALLIPNGRKLFGVIILVSVVFRAMFLVTPPIMEIDYFRYLWDGKVAQAGFSPYRYSPDQVLRKLPNQSEEYSGVVNVSVQSASVHEILSRVHFPNYTTIYPPVSQAVFAWAVKWVSPQASVKRHVWTLRLVLVLFDLGTLAALVLLLRYLQRHVGWSIVWAWNPLTLKEIANSGHLDSIVVFFMFVSIAGLIMASQCHTAQPDLRKQKVKKTLWLLQSTFCLALAIGAKLFPLILLPAFFVNWWYISKRGALGLTVLLVLATAVVMWPMLRQNPNIPRHLSHLGILQQDKEVDPLVLENLNSEGLSGFLSRWRINDPIFELAYDNLHPRQDQNLNQPPYAFVPLKTKQWLNDWVDTWNPTRMRPAFLIARCLTFGLFLLIYLMCLRKFLTNDPHQLLANFFFVLVAFLLLQPTVNPWYWLWALPLSMFAKNRGWLLLPALLFIYYLRFRFRRWDGVYEVLGNSYSGSGLFDNFVIFAELGLIAIVLIVGHFRSRQSDGYDENETEAKSED